MPSKDRLMRWAFHCKHTVANVSKERERETYKLYTARAHTQWKLAFERPTYECYLFAGHSPIFCRHSLSTIRIRIRSFVRVQRSVRLGSFRVLHS